METTINQTPAPQAPTSQTTLESLAEAWAMFRIICHFVPVISSLGWLIICTFNPPDVVTSYVLIPIILLGVLAALIAAPLQFIKAAFRLAAWGWRLGWTLCPFFGSAIFAGALGAIFGAMLTVFVPGAITIYNFFKD